MSNLTKNKIITGIEVLVCSGGGNGTTSLIRSLQAFKKTNCPSDTDGLKHCGLPPFCLDPGVQYLFLWGDPVDAAISLFRRGFHSSQSAKLQKHKAHAKISRLPKELTIEEYAEIGVDGLHIEEQFDNWAGDYPATNRVLFVNFNKMWENMGALAQQLGLPNGEPSRFFPTKKGRSERSELAPSTQSRLQSIYAPLKAKLAVLPDLYIREPDLVLSAMRPGTEQAK